jgi:hypothetical protein
MSFVVLNLQAGFDDPAPPAGLCSLGREPGLAVKCKTCISVPLTADYGPQAEPGPSPAAEATPINTGCEAMPWKVATIW